MKVTHVAIAMFVMAGILCAQLPSNIVNIGTTLRTQTGGINNQQRVSVFADPNSSLPDGGLGLRARIGGTVFAYAAAYDDLSTPVFLPPQPINHWFSLVWMDSVAHTLPIAEPGHNWVFGTPNVLYAPTHQFEWLGPSIWDYEQVGVSSPAGWQAFFLRIPIPANSLLTGSAVSVQSYRYDLSQRFFVSDEAVFVIG